MGSCSRIIVAAFVLLPCFCIDVGAAKYSITSSQFIEDPQVIVSPGNTFRLGFFTPINSTNRYVGIWYNQSSVITPIWVANRNKPLNDSSGIMTVTEDGNLVVLNGQKEVLWSSNISNSVQNSSAHLTDDGNLVLQDNTRGNTTWESFQQPCHMLVSNARLTADQRTGEKKLLTSWKSPSDPSTGSFTAGIDPQGIPEVLIWNGSHPHWRSGPWSGKVFIGIPGMSSFYLQGFTLDRDRNGIFSLDFSFSETPLVNYHIVLSPDGKLLERYMLNNTESWEGEWEVPATECDVYGICGAFGVCNVKNSPICSCLRGYEPKNSDEWTRGNWTGGCVRRRLLQCDINKNANGSELAKQDGFLKLETMKVPAAAQLSGFSEQQCAENCLNDCSCVAYSYYTGFGCMSWTGDLIDLQKFSSDGADLYIRLDKSELDNKRNRKAIVAITVPAVAIFLLICAFFIWKCKAKNRERKRQQIEQTVPYVKNVIDNMNQVKLQELPVFSLQKLVAATDSFDVINKLGEGGFGPVYKGELPDGQEIAVKRLSRASGQGLEEFMNEVKVISKLQHRNLVRLLGCSVEGDEKMLVYEYMPNKSLDAFLFDPCRKELLDWRKRFHIIEGICRGLLYLHRDSRLRIIHRDLKASNILLDQQLNPKISDFGMARIFGGNQDHANTRRVVGTYGYMSPEYAMQGLFSEKSDVFSFGVLLLEIISGRRNTSFYENEQASSLVGFAWKLWNEGNTAALVDPVLSDPCPSEIFRCIHVGLLCVQELAKDRPAVSTVLPMINSEIVDLPSPQQPAFTQRQIDSSCSNTQRSLEEYSVNVVTLSVVGGR